MPNTNSPEQENDQRSTEEDASIRQMQLLRSAVDRNAVMITLYENSEPLLLGDPNQRYINTIAIYRRLAEDLTDASEDMIVLTFNIGMRVLNGSRNPVALLMQYGRSFFFRNQSFADNIFPSQQGHRIMNTASTMDEHRQNSDDEMQEDPENVRTSDNSI